MHVITKEGQQMALYSHIKVYCLSAVYACTCLCFLPHVCVLEKSLREMEVS